MQGAPELEGRAPLELVVAHVERFVRSHLASLVTIAHVRPSADGMDAESGERVSSDAALLIEWLDALREAAREGRMHDASALSQEIAERTLGTGEAVARAR
jgi:hypothetical protein